MAERPKVKPSDLVAKAKLIARLQVVRQRWQAELAKVEAQLRVERKFLQDLAEKAVENDVVVLSGELDQPPAS